MKILGVNIKRPFGASHKDVASNGGGFLGGGSGASEYAINDGFVDNFDWLQAEPERLIYNKKHRRMFLAVAVLMWIIILSGLGAIFGWLFMNGEQTMAERVLRQPRTTVPILKPEDKADRSKSDVIIMSDSQTMSLGSLDDSGSISMTPRAEEKTPTASQQVAATDEAMLELSGQGALPIIPIDGRVSWQYYARSIENDDRPRIALVVSELGLSDVNTRSAIATLPGVVSLSFSAFSANLQDKIDLAKADGHEVLLDLPMEPLNYPRDDPGPKTLLTSASVVKNLEHLEWIMAQGAGYVGFISKMGGRFTTDGESLMPILEAIRDRGLMLVDGRASSRSLVTELATSIQLPLVYNNSFIDRQPKRAEIEKRLRNLEARARSERAVVGIATGLPVTVDVLKDWIKGLDERGVTLAPVSAIVDLQRIL